MGEKITKQTLIKKLKAVYKLIKETEKEANEPLTIHAIKAHRILIEETFKEILK